MEHVPKKKPFRLAASLIYRINDNRLLDRILNKANMSNVEHGNSSVV